MIVLKILAALFVVVLTILAAVVSFLFCVAGAVCVVGCVVLTLLAVVLFIGGQTLGGAVFLVLAFLVSPYGTGSERIEQFMALAVKYRDCTEYSDEVLRRFVEKVVVHETQRDADGERSREIEVYLSFIGKFSVPAEPARLSLAEQKHQEALKKRRIHDRNKRALKRKKQMNMK